MTFQFFRMQKSLCVQKFVNLVCLKIRIFPRFLAFPRVIRIFENSTSEQKQEKVTKNIFYNNVKSIDAGEMTHHLTQK